LWLPAVEKVPRLRALLRSKNERERRKEADERLGFALLALKKIQNDGLTDSLGRVRAVVEHPLTTPYYRALWLAFTHATLNEDDQTTLVLFERDENKHAFEDAFLLAHAEEMAGSASAAENWPGEARRGPSWIAGSRPGNGFFVPPPPPRASFGGIAAAALLDPARPRRNAPSPPRNPRRSARIEPGPPRHLARSRRIPLARPVKEASIPWDRPPSNAAARPIPTDQPAPHGSVAPIPPERPTSAHHAASIPPNRPLSSPNLRLDVLPAGSIASLADGGDGLPPVFTERQAPE
jgi:hypothetical protein